MFKVISIAAVMALTSTASFAGSLNAGTEEAEVDPNAGYVPPLLAGGAGIGAPAVIGGALAAIAIGSLINKSSSTTTTPIGG
ncbi:hypothetical protein [Sulfitobacter guttiformis]|uniref:Secreted protein n=1 Tax=Sulfitobacter guttiformis TaxID=74349 RepID=A0A420DJ18_9RHOB|nr:hypothetical protein [Sulfitobacter guttiformis]KIN72002.1 hypothetical protein Z949_1169 [Sulfitobacter guttiformis KCTC 32187]RKE94207.1 hypothetical protein C8N30_3324 [Sulfitobacter guttiformis]